MSKIAPEPKDDCYARVHIQEDEESQHTHVTKAGCCNLCSRRKKEEHNLYRIKSDEHEGDDDTQSDEDNSIVVAESANETEEEEVRERLESWGVPDKVLDTLPDWCKLLVYSFLRPSVSCEMSFKIILAVIIYTIMLVFYLYFLILAWDESGDLGKVVKLSSSSVHELRIYVTGCALMISSVSGSSLTMKDVTLRAPFSNASSYVSFQDRGDCLVASCSGPADNIGYMPAAKLEIGRSAQISKTKIIVKTTVQSSVMLTDAAYGQTLQVAGEKISLQIDGIYVPTVTIEASSGFVDIRNSNLFASLVLGTASVSFHPKDGIRTQVHFAVNSGVPQSQVLEGLCLSSSEGKPNVSYTTASSPVPYFQFGSGAVQNLMLLTRGRVNKSMGQAFVVDRVAQAQRTKTNTYDSTKDAGYEVEPDYERWANQMTGHGMQLLRFRALGPGMDESPGIQDGREWLYSRHGPIYMWHPVSLFYLATLGLWAPRTARSDILMTSMRCTPSTTVVSVDICEPADNITHTQSLGGLHAALWHSLPDVLNTRNMTSSELYSLRPYGGLPKKNTYIFSTLSQAIVTKFTNGPDANSDSLVEFEATDNTDKFMNTAAKMFYAVGVIVIILAPCGLVWATVKFFNAERKRIIMCEGPRLRPKLAKKQKERGMQRRKPDKLMKISEDAREDSSVGLHKYDTQDFDELMKDVEKYQVCEMKNQGDLYLCWEKEFTSLRELIDKMLREGRPPPAFAGSIYQLAVGAYAQAFTVAGGATDARPAELQAAEEKFKKDMTAAREAYHKAVAKKAHAEFFWTKAGATCEHVKKKSHELSVSADDFVTDDQIEILAESCLIKVPLSEEKVKATRDQWIYMALNRRFIREVFKVKWMWADGGLCWSSDKTASDTISELSKYTDGHAHCCTTCGCLKSRRKKARRVTMFINKREFGGHEAVYEDIWAAVCELETYATERRVDPACDNRAVTYQEMRRELDWSDRKLLFHWNNLPSKEASIDKLIENNIHFFAFLEGAILSHIPGRSKIDGLPGALCTVCLHAGVVIILCVPLTAMFFLQIHNTMDAQGNCAFMRMVTGDCRPNTLVLPTIAGVLLPLVLAFMLFYTIVQYLSRQIDHILLDKKEKKSQTPSTQDKDNTENGEKKSQTSSVQDKGNPKMSKHRKRLLSIKASWAFQVTFGILMATLLSTTCMVIVGFVMYLTLAACVEPSVIVPVLLGVVSVPFVAYSVVSSLKKLKEMLAKQCHDLAKNAKGCKLAGEKLEAVIEEVFLDAGFSNTQIMLASFFTAVCFTCFIAWILLGCSLFIASGSIFPTFIGSATVLGSAGATVGTDKGRNTSAKKMQFEKFFTKRLKQFEQYQENLDDEMDTANEKLDMASHVIEESGESLDKVTEALPGEPKVTEEAPPTVDDPTSFSVEEVAHPDESTEATPLPNVVADQTAEDVAVESVAAETPREEESAAPKTDAATEESPETPGPEMKIAPPDTVDPDIAPHPEKALPTPEAPPADAPPEEAPAAESLTAPEVVSEAPAEAAPPEIQIVPTVPVEAALPEPQTVSTDPTTALPSPEADSTAPATAAASASLHEPVTDAPQWVTGAPRRVSNASHEPVTEVPAAPTMQRPASSPPPASNQCSSDDPGWDRLATSDSKPSLTPEGRFIFGAY